MGSERPKNERRENDQNDWGEEHAQEEGRHPNETKDKEVGRPAGKGPAHRQPFAAAAHDFDIKRHLPKGPLPT